MAYREKFTPEKWGNVDGLKEEGFSDEGEGAIYHKKDMDKG